MTRRISVEVPDMFFDVGQFHFKFGLETLGSGTPTLLPPDVQQFRENFLQEELNEYREACTAGDLGKAVDALIDLVYVALGTAHMHRVSFNQHWDLVHEKNMLKERRKSDIIGANGETIVDDRSVRGHTLDVVKPAGWTPPDHQPILDRIAAAFPVLAKPAADTQH